MKQPQLRDYIYFPRKRTSLLAPVTSPGTSPVSGGAQPVAILQPDKS